MQFQFDVTSNNATPLPAGPQQPAAESPTDLLRQMLDLQREQFAQMLEVQREHLNHLRAASADALARWRNLLARWQKAYPEFSNQCKSAYPVLEKAYVHLLVALVEELGQQDDEALENDFAVQEFLDRYGMRLGQLSHLLSVIGPLAEAANQAEAK